LAHFDTGKKVPSEFQDLELITDNYYAYYSE
jgi:hypothetical protein